MIIQCINCDKSFKVSSALIPQEGRKIQCGSCNHTWFYKHSVEQVHNNLSETNKEKEIPQTNKENEIPQISVIEKNTIHVDNDENKNKNDIIINENSENITEFENQVQINKSSIISIEKILSYFIVSIITFVAFIIILDTFKTPLNNKFPSLELILYNLFETIEDISLFLKNLFF
tara:strand:+ start:123 stop:647 length:525 start_codon:yes stop_codon:yes gene_type:complete